MAVEYDLIVIGNTSAGRYAAGLAARSHARVAWVTQTPPYLSSPPFFLEQDDDAATALMTQGVDVVEEKGKFIGDRHSRQITVITPTRHLTARKALLAVGSHYAIPFIGGFSDVPYFLPETVRSQPSQFRGQRVVIIGDDPEGIEIAILLQGQGTEVILMTPQPNVLPLEEPELVHALQAHLEALGIECLTQTTVSDVEPAEEYWQVWAESRTNPQQRIDVQAEHIVLATTKRPDLADLNLEALGCPVDKPLQVDAYLRTDYRHLFACGDSLGGYSCPEIARREAQVAVQNALWNRRIAINYRSQPWHLNTLLPFARVGLTDAQARRYHPKSCERILIPWNCQIPIRGGLLTGLCKLIVAERGQLVGAHLLSAQAHELIATLALVIDQQLPLQSLVNLHSVSTSEFAHVRNGIERWLLQQQSQDLRQRDRQEDFFWRQRLR
jgi:pyruvate/2-oxoglutarate dehydrogenase complex dihydrolipoamide dehydrogenase (E3) component